MDSVRHLNADELHRLIEARGDVTADQQLDQARLHLVECELCRRLVHMHGDAQSNLRRLSADVASRQQPTCPAAARWRGLAAGILTEHEQGELLEHVIGCDACAQIYRQASEDFAEGLSREEQEILSSLESSKPDWQRNMAEKVRPASEQIRDSAVRDRPDMPQIRPRRQIRFYAYATAAVVLLGIGFFAAYRTVWRDTPAELLAQAYHEQRTLELRIANAQYAPLRQERGTVRSSLEKPTALLRAEFEINERMSSHPEDPTVLAAKGRAELLEWQYDEAINSLKHSLDLDPGVTEVLCDLATAYVQRGDVEKRPIDYGQAIEYLGEALQKEPTNAIALFNRAIAEERLNLVEQSIKDWEAYLRIDPQGDWATEARQRLRALQKKKDDSSLLLQIEPDPARAAPLLEMRASATETRKSWPDSLDEDYADVAVRQWLPAIAHGSKGTDVGATPTSERHALVALARILVERHHDAWLSDVLATPQSAQMLEGWKELAVAVRSNSAGDFDAAAVAAARAESLLGARCRPGYLRALWERAYALQRAQQGRACLATIAAAGDLNAAERYPWLLTQLELERSVCSAMVGEMGATPSEIQSAASLAESANYDTLLLRAYHLLGIQAASQDPEHAWLWFEKGLNRHWGGTYRPFRAYQFYAEMSFTPETWGQWHLARILMEEAVSHIARTPNHLMEAVARHSLAVDAQLAGESSEAAAQFREAARIFSTLPSSPSRNALLFSAQVYQASLESEQGNNDKALEALHSARQNLAKQTQYWVWLHYYQAMGETLLRRGDTDESERALRSAIYISESALASIASETDRILWERHTERAYRSLVQLEFEKKHNPRRALELWQWYLSARSGVPRVPEAQPGVDFDALESDPPLPRSISIGATLAQLRGSTTISVAETGDGYLAWFFDDRGIESTKIDVAPTEVHSVVRRLARLCSDRSSDTRDIRQLGSRLYDWFLAPFAARLDPSRVLIMQLDGELRNVPVGLFVTPHGEFLAESYALTVSSGPGLSTQAQAADNFSPQDDILVVGNSSSGLSFNEVQLPSLPDAEAEARDIAADFAHPRLLVGNQANLLAIERDLGSARVLHFAGHAITSATRNGLLVASSGATTDREGGIDLFEVEELNRLPVRRLRLVVLSACATGVEDFGPEAPRALVQGFLRAGIPRVVGSLWDVDSRSTREVMNEFYKDLLRGNTPSEALKLASDSIRKHSETSHPYYWAGFTVFGSS